MPGIVRVLQTVSSEMVGVEVSHRMLIVIDMSRLSSMFHHLRVFVSELHFFLWERGSEPMLSSWSLLPHRWHVWLVK